MQSRSIRAMGSPSSIRSMFSASLSHTRRLSDRALRTMTVYPSPSRSTSPPATRSRSHATMSTWGWMLTHPGTSPHERGTMPVASEAMPSSEVGTKTHAVPAHHEREHQMAREHAAAWPTPRMRSSEVMPAEDRSRMAASAASIDGSSDSVNVIENPASASARRTASRTRASVPGDTIACARLGEPTTFLRIRGSSSSRPDPKRKSVQALPKLTSWRRMVIAIHAPTISRHRYRTPR